MMARRNREYIGFQIPAELKRQIEAAAQKQMRSISAEATSRLEESFAFEGLRPLAYALASAYLRGPSALLQELLNRQGNDHERCLLWLGLKNALRWRDENAP